MLNFREELNQIISEKLYGNEVVRPQAELILEKILDYFRVKSKEEFNVNGMELVFTCNNDKLYVKEYSKKENEIYNFVFFDSETASEVLCYLESKLLSEGFLKTSSLSARKNGHFKVKIV